jgi:AraC-like DNA-binding protein
MKRPEIEEFSLYAEIEISDVLRRISRPEREDVTLSTGPTHRPSEEASMSSNSIDPGFSVLDYAIDLAKTGILSVDGEGRVWRHFEKTRYSRRAIETRRAENPTKKGYLSITLGVPGTHKTRGVLAHVLVWTLLHGQIPDGIQVNHKDLNKANNRPDNLELMTGSQNTQHAYDNGRAKPWKFAKEWRPGISKRTTEEIARLFDLRRQGKTQKEICALMAISRTHLQRLFKKGESQ